MTASREITVKDIDLALRGRVRPLLAITRSSSSLSMSRSARIGTRKYPAVRSRSVMPIAKASGPGVAKIVYEEFVKELQNKSSYKLTDEAGPDVLRVKVKIVNLYVQRTQTRRAPEYHGSSPFRQEK